ncbi:MAG: hypothetical protein GTN97_01630 [Nitrosopumilaceae archaeon]|nr:hypothetical protein [Nitrosopumilaceae archaeon]
MSYDHKALSAQMKAIDDELERDQVEGLNEFTTQEIETQKKKNPHSVPTTVFTYNGTKYPILSQHSPFPIVKRILTHNSVTGYTGIINAGQSGTGKTTWTKWLVHQLHQQMPSVVVDWFDQYDVNSIDEIIHGLTKGVPHIIVFDDASFAMDDLPRKEVNKLAQVLTRIRHEVKANVISILNIHYSKAIGKYWRNIPFYFLTSISNEELGSYEDVFGSGSKWKLRDFSYMFHDMMLDGGWRIQIDAWKDEYYKYKTNAPFRLGLASELNRLHFFVYAKDSCAMCDKEYDTKRVLGARDLVDQLVQAYNKPQVRSTLRYYLLTRKGITKSIDRRVRSLWNTISDLDRKNDIDFNEVAEILDESLVNKRKRFYSKKQQTKDMIDKIESNSSIYKETERNSKMIDPSVLEKETNVEETHMGDFAWKGLDDN